MLQRLHPKKRPETRAADHAPPQTEATPPTERREPARDAPAGMPSTRMRMASGRPPEEADDLQLKVFTSGGETYLQEGDGIPVKASALGFAPGALLDRRAPRGPAPARSPQRRAPPVPAFDAGLDLIPAALASTPAWRELQWLRSTPFDVEGMARDRAGAVSSRDMGLLLAQSQHIEELTKEAHGVFTRILDKLATHHAFPTIQERVLEARAAFQQRALAQEAAIKQAQEAIFRAGD